MNKSILFAGSLSHRIIATGQACVRIIEEDEVLLERIAVIEQC